MTETPELCKTIDDSFNIESDTFDVNPFITDLDPMRNESYFKSADCTEDLDQIYENVHNLECIEPIVKIEEGETKEDIVYAKDCNPNTKLCPLCGKVLRTNSYNLHMKRHKGVKKFPCAVCGKHFISNCTRKQHEIIHLKIRGFPCDQCGKKFSSRKLSIKHTNDVHLKLQRVQCSVCGKYLSTKASFENHMKTHTGQRDFECDICHKKFIHKFSIVCHLRMHTGDRPFRCNYCPSRFTHPKSLVEHERLHTGEVPYKCPMCGKGFAQQGNMKSHVKYNHKDAEFVK